MMHTTAAEIDEPGLNHGGLYLIRHGLTDWNADGRFQGTSDIPLNDHGRNQSRLLGRRLADHFENENLSAESVILYSSTLLRARQTAEIVCRELSVNADRISHVDALREVSFGDWEGMTTLEVKAAFPVARRARKADRWTFAPPGGEAPVTRVSELQSFLETVQQPAVIVTHTGVIRICLYLLGFVSHERALTEPISQDKVHMISNGSLARI